jgi:hypothetical protein
MFTFFPSVMCAYNLSLFSYSMMVVDEGVLHVCRNMNVPWMMGMTNL